MSLAPGPVCVLQFHEEYDLIWADACAPEVCIDFDAPNISTRKALKWFLGAFGGFFTLYQLAGATDPRGRKPTVRAA
jgi:hypothetical protein